MIGKVTIVLTGDRERTLGAYDFVALPRIGEIVAGIGVDGDFSELVIVRIEHSPWPSDAQVRDKPDPNLSTVKVYVARQAA